MEQEILNSFEDLKDHLNNDNIKITINGDNSVSLRYENSGGDEADKDIFFNSGEAFIIFVTNYPRIQEY
jgi:hypothetical protein